jgi:predicted XRE-type DNA-binding protein
MSTRRRKSSKPASSPPEKSSGSKSGPRVRAAEDLVKAYQKQMKERSGDRSKSLPDNLMRNFQEFLARWVVEHCTTDGKAWAQRPIAETLGVTQPEYGDWMRDDARPGISRLVDIRKKTGMPLDVILGLDKSSS